MQFLLLAYDGSDAESPARRAAARPEHLALADLMRQSGALLYAAALLDGDDLMNGSMMVLDFPSRAELDVWLETEPYVVQGVWERVEVSACRPGPAFMPEEDLAHLPD